MSYHHLSTFERGRIEELLSLGYSHREIATRLGRHRSCVDREINRNRSATGYIGEYAETTYRTRRCNSKPKGKLSKNLTSIIEEKLIATWLQSKLLIL